MPLEGAVGWAWADFDGSIARLLEPRGGAAPRWGMGASEGRSCVSELARDVMGPGGSGVRFGVGGLDRYNYTDTRRGFGI